MNIKEIEKFIDRIEEVYFSEPKERDRLIKVMYDRGYIKQLLEVVKSEVLR